MQYSIEETKTTSGTRDISMTEEVREGLERIVANRKHPKMEAIIDGYTVFFILRKKQQTYDDSVTLGEVYLLCNWRI